MGRPARYWDTRQYRTKEARISADYYAYRRGDWVKSGWEVCPCHGRYITFHSWAGLLKH